MYKKLGLQAMKLSYGGKCISTNVVQMYERKIHDTLNTL